MKLLLDTCTFLWAVSAPERLPAGVAGMILAEEHEVFVSAASAWEIAIKVTTGRLALRGAPDRFVREQREASGFATLPIDEESALHVGRLPGLHRDPFDRMLVSQAIVHGMTILTPDPLVVQYPARTAW
ncbi:MAG: type II toxin-antitoxin system VapC family toxin [Acidobacteria bacterium]|nr:type II toxin-antitoxin system VapC family toxin [Acidobacteriota bacterium]